MTRPGRWDGAMATALELARLAPEHGDVPVGAVRANEADRRTAEVSVRVDPCSGITRSWPTSSARAKWSVK